MDEYLKMDKVQKDTALGRWKNYPSDPQSQGSLEIWYNQPWTLPVPPGAWHANNYLFAPVAVNAGDGNIHLFYAGSGESHG